MKIKHDKIIKIINEEIRKKLREQDLDDSLSERPGLSPVMTPEEAVEELGDSVDLEAGSDRLGPAAQTSLPDKPGLSIVPHKPWKNADSPYDAEAAYRWLPSFLRAQNGRHAVSIFTNKRVSNDLREYSGHAEGATYPWAEYYFANQLLMNGVGVSQRRSHRAVKKETERPWAPDTGEDEELTRESVLDRWERLLSEQPVNRRPTEREFGSNQEAPEGSVVRAADHTWKKYNTGKPSNKWQLHAPIPAAFGRGEGVNLWGVIIRPFDHGRGPVVIKRRSTSAWEKPGSDITGIPDYPILEAEWRRAHEPSGTSPRIDTSSNPPLEDDFDDYAHQHIYTYLNDVTITDFWKLGFSEEYVIDFARRLAEKQREIQQDRTKAGFAVFRCVKASTNPMLGVYPDPGVRDFLNFMGEFYALPEWVPLIGGVAIIKDPLGDMGRICFFDHWTLDPRNANKDREIFIRDEHWNNWHKGLSGTDATWDRE